MLQLQLNLFIQSHKSHQSHNPTSFILCFLFRGATCQLPRIVCGHAAHFRELPMLFFQHMVGFQNVFPKMVHSSQIHGYPLLNLLLSCQIQVLIFPACFSSSCCAFFFFSFFLFVLPSSGLASSFFLLFVCFLFFLLAYPVMKNPSANLALPYCITIVCQSAAYFSCLLVFFLLCILLLLLRLLVCSSFFWSCVFFFLLSALCLFLSFSCLLILI